MQNLTLARKITSPTQNQQRLSAVPLRLFCTPKKSLPTPWLTLTNLEHAPTPTHSSLILPEIVWTKTGLSLQDGDHVQHVRYQDIARFINSLLTGQSHKRFEFNHVLAITLMLLTQIAATNAQNNTTAMTAVLFQMKDYSCTLTMLNTLQLSNGNKIDLTKTMQTTVNYLMTLQAVYGSCKKIPNSYKYNCPYAYSCDIVSNRPGTPNQQGSAIDYIDTEYRFFYVAEVGSYPVSWVDCTNGKMNNCIYSRADHYIENLTGSSGKWVAAIISAELFGIICLFSIMTLICRNRIRTSISDKLSDFYTNRRRVREEQAAEMTQLLPNPTSSATPVATISDADFEANAAEAQAQEQRRSPPGGYGTMAK